MTTCGMWDWYAKHRQGYAPIDTRLAVDCSPGNGGAHCVGGTGGNGSDAHCSGGGSGANSGGGSSSSLGWASPGSRRHFYNNHHHHHRYSYHQEGSMWGRSNGCSPGPVPGAHHQHQHPHPQQQRQPHPHRTLTPPPSLPSASSWGTLPSMYRSNTPNPSPWGSSSQISNGSAWNSGPTSGDCMLGPSSPLHLCFTVPYKVSFRKSNSRSHSVHITDDVIPSVFTCNVFVGVSRGYTDYHQGRAIHMADSRIH